MGAIHGYVFFKVAVARDSDWPYKFIEIVSRIAGHAAIKDEHIIYVQLLQMRQAVASSDARAAPIRPIQ